MKQHEYVPAGERVVDPLKRLLPYLGPRPRRRKGTKAHVDNAKRRRRRKIARASRKANRR